MKSKLSLFGTGFIQVFLVVLNTYFIAKDFLLGLIICGFMISFVWSHNVKKIAFGSEKDRVIYSLAAMIGSIAAFYLGKFLLKS